MSALSLFGDEPEPEPEPHVVPERHTERSMLARLAARHTERHGNGARWVFATHVRSDAGFGDFNGGNLRTADAVAMDMWPSKRNELHGFEVKVARSDWLNELRDPSKAHRVKRFMDRWWLVVPTAGMVRPGELPADWGLLVCHGSGLRVAKAAPRLTPEPITKSFVAALLRAAVNTDRKAQRQLRAAPPVTDTEAGRDA